MINNLQSHHYKARKTTDRRKLINTYKPTTGRNYLPRLTPPASAKSCYVLATEHLRHVLPVFTEADLLANNTQPNML